MPMAVTNAEPCRVGNLYLTNLAQNKQHSEKKVKNVVSYLRPLTRPPTG